MNLGHRCKNVQAIQFFTVLTKVILYGDYFSGTERNYRSLGLVALLENVGLLRFSSTNRMLTRKLSFRVKSKT